MTLLLMDGFDGIPSGYSTTSYLAQNFTVVGSGFGNVAGFEDGKALLIDYPGKNNTSQLSKTIPSGTDFIFGCRFRSGSQIPNLISDLRVNIGLLSIVLNHTYISSPNSYRTVAIFYNGSEVAKASSSPILSNTQLGAGATGDYRTWRHLELKMVNGIAVTLYIDGVQSAVWTNPTLASTTSFTITSYTNTWDSTGHSWNFDDLYLMNTSGSFANNLLGTSAKIKIKPPTTAGSLNDFTTYSGSTLINSIATVDGNHSSSAIIDQKLLATTDEIVDDVQVLGARTLAYTQNSDTPTKDIQDIIAIDGTVTNKGITYTPSVGVYGLKINEQFIDPLDSSQFTKARLAALQFGVQIK